MNLRRFSGFLLAHHLRRTMIVNPEGYSPYLKVLLASHKAIAEVEELESALQREVYTIKRYAVQLKKAEMNLLWARAFEGLDEDEQEEVARRAKELHDEALEIMYG